MPERHSALCAVTAHNVSRETFDRLVEFERTFLHWARRINLAASSTLDDIWSRHILDSAQLEAIGATRGLTTWVDLGSGGGFPGAIIAILSAERPDRSVTLVESNRKKASFLRNALAGLAPHAEIVGERAESFIAEHTPPAVVSARALADLGSLLTLCEPWLTQQTVGLFHKGRDYREELKLAHDTWNFDLVEHASAVDPESVVLEIRNVRRIM